MENSPSSNIVCLWDLFSLELCSLSGLNPFDLIWNQKSNIQNPTWATFTCSFAQNNKIGIWSLFRLLTNYSRFVSSLPLLFTQYVTIIMGITALEHSHIFYNTAYILSWPGCHISSSPMFDENDIPPELTEVKQLKLCWPPVEKTVCVTVEW